MKKIKRTPVEVSGVKDNVEMEAKCSVTRFLEDKMAQQVFNCKVMASWDNGTLSISWGRKPRQMIAVRLDELTMLLKEAAEARTESEGK